MYSSPERLDVTDHPLDTRLLIEVTEVGRRLGRLFRNLRMRDETERAETVVHAYEHNASLRDILSVKFHLRRITPLEAAAKEPHWVGEPHQIETPFIFDKRVFFP